MTAAVSPITRQTVGRTFIVAISLLAAAALAQVSAVAWLFLLRYDRSAPNYLAQTTGADKGLTSNRDFSDPFADALTIVPAMQGLTTAPPVLGAATPPPAAPRPAPFSPQLVNPDAIGDGTTQDRLAEIVEQAKLLRERGDTYAAITKLKEAQALDSRNPLPYAELAMTYEKMGSTDKANEQWEKIYAMGEAAGPIYYAAAQGRKSADKERALRQAQANGGSGLDSTPGETVGLTPASRLGFQEITKQEVSDTSVRRRFVLRVPIRARSRARIDPKYVTVQVVFYDVISGRTLERTKADVSYRFTSPPADWADEDIEILEVEYSLPSVAQGEPTEDRKYYGYIASIYYKNALQDFRSEPSRLGQQAPPPQTIPQEIAP